MLEEVVLGVIMLDKEVLFVVLDIFWLDSFYLDVYKLIYKVMFWFFEKL